MNTADRTGSDGGALITALTGNVTGLNVSCVECLEDTVFAVLKNELYRTGAALGQALTTRTWKRGDRIYGLTRAITITSGAVFAHDQV